MHARNGEVGRAQRSREGLRHSERRRNGASRHPGEGSPRQDRETANAHQTLLAHTGQEAALERSVSVEAGRLREGPIGANMRMRRPGRNASFLGLALEFLM